MSNSKEIKNMKLKKKKRFQHKKIPAYWVLAQLISPTLTREEAYKLWKESQ